MYGVSQTVTKMVRTIVNQTVRYKRNYTKKQRLVDPGIQNRKSLVNENEEFEQLNDYDFDFEADFMNVASSHEEHEQEQMFLKEKEKYLIVKQKYFKEKLPNFLTWSDKEQIRYLHKTNPEEWTLDKLSEGFPALPEVIAKIVKSDWIKTSDNKIQNHDESVKRNWMLFKTGKLSDLPPNLVEHLRKFTNRDLNFRSFEIPEQFKTKKVNSMIAPNLKVGSEFSEIIRSYKRLKNKDQNDTKELCAANNDKLQQPPKKDTYLLNSVDSKKYGKHITLDNLQQQVCKKAKGGRLSADEELLFNEIQHEKRNDLEKQLTEHFDEDKALESTTLINNAIDNKYKSNKAVAIDKTVAKDFDKYVVYPERIIIPKNKFKKGYTYKLNDCYYDDDGEFLYRVPGMYK